MWLSNIARIIENDYNTWFDEYFGKSLFRLIPKRFHMSNLLRFPVFEISSSNLITLSITIFTSFGIPEHCKKWLSSLCWKKRWRCLELESTFTLVSKISANRTKLTVHNLIALIRNWAIASGLAAEQVKGDNFWVKG